jgi:TolB-like protein/Tfp pilus assembly protein PilF
MKRCPECRRDYLDDSLLYCLEDGTALVQGSVPSPDGPQTAILHETAAAGEAATRAQIHTTEQTAAVPSGVPEVRKLGFDKRILAAPLLLAVIVIGFFGYRYFSAGAGSASIDSIAVLPFQNVSGDPNLEYLSDGIAESLINSLTQLQQLKVIARNTAFRYKGKDVDAEQIGRDLSVGAVLTGRVRQIGDRLNIQVDLVNAVTGAQLWGEEYERPLSDALSIKQAIAREVTEKLRLRLSGEQLQQLTARETSNSEAFQSYLRGRYYWNRRSADGLKKAITEFQQAVDRDPNYALGYVGLADCYLVLEEYAGVPATETLPKAEAAVERALQTDPTLAEARTSRAFLYHHQWRWAEAEEEFRRSIALNPNYPTTRHWFSVYLRAKRRFAEGLAETKLAQALDPLSPAIGNNVAMMYMLMNDADSAEREWKKTLDLDPNFAPSYSNLGGLVYIKQGRYEEAIAACQRAVQLSGGASLHSSILGHAYAVSGKRAEALQILKELEERYAKGESNGQNVARIHNGLGDKDQALAWLEKDFEKRSGMLSVVVWWFAFDDLRSDPRYADLMRRMNLPQ